jgi:hypothetical protein
MKHKKLAGPAILPPMQSSSQYYKRRLWYDEQFSARLHVDDVFVK